MLLEFSCRNHKSIRNDVVFSALAGKDTELTGNLYPYKSLNVLNSAVVYGANGSGKSNFINAIQFMKLLVTKSIGHQPGVGINQTPHKLEGFNTESTYKIQFVKNGIRYAYGFSLKQLLVTEEYLYYFPNGRQAKIFDRTGEKFEVGSKFRGKFNSCKDVLKPNRLLLSCAANFTAVKEIEEVYRFFAEDIVIYNGNNQQNWMDYSLQQFNSNPQMKKAVLAFMQGLNLDIKDIDIKIEESELPEIAIPEFLSDEFKNKISQGKAQSITAKVKYSTFDTDLMLEESTGIQKLFAFLCPFLDIIVKGKILICDELEANLHESLVCGILQLFAGLKVETCPQIFFTTHDTSILNLDLFRRDQIWFTELRKEDRSTELFSLAEIKNIRKDENYGKGYISGRYGAIPMLNVNLANIISDI